MNFDTVLIVSLIALAAFWTVGLLRSRLKDTVIALALAIGLLGLSSTPAIAAQAASDKGIVENPAVPQEQLKETSPGSQYSGIEYANDQLGGRTISDETLKSRIKDVRDDLAVAVSNGSVRISGTVENKEVARNVVDDIKEIPGIHEITFDLGLEEAANVLR
ncbi:MAG: hypothetical protein ACTS2F_11705 [Thainema sp.]